MGIVYYFKLIPEFLWQNTACFSAVHKLDANVDYTLFDYVIFSYQTITLHKNKVQLVFRQTSRPFLSTPAAAGQVRSTMMSVFGLLVFQAGG